MLSELLLLNENGPRKSSGFSPAPSPSKAHISSRSGGSDFLSLGWVLECHTSRYPCINHKILHLIKSYNNLLFLGPWFLYSAMPNHL